MRATLILFSALLMTACSAIDLPNGPSTPAAPTDGPLQPSEQPTPVEPTGTPAQTGDVPTDILQALLDEVSALSGVVLGDLRVERAERVTWSDASLGCPEPDVGYAQVLTDGYWVVVIAGGDTYDFRIGDDGGPPRLCPPGEGVPPLDQDF